jgi:amino acid transporter
MHLALGEKGARLIAIGIAISTLGFLSQSMLTAPRVYFAMADDKLFFKSVAWVAPTSHVPVVAIALQGVWAAVIALSGTFEQILNYVVSVDFIAYGLCGRAAVLKGCSANRYNAPGRSRRFHEKVDSARPFGVCIVRVRTRDSPNSPRSRPSFGRQVQLGGLPRFVFQS